MVGWQCWCGQVHEVVGPAPFGWTVIRRDTAKCGFVTYKRDCPADAAHFTADLAPFTFPTRAEAMEQGRIGNYAYRTGGDEVQTSGR